MGKSTTTNNPGCTQQPSESEGCCKGPRKQCYVLFVLCTLSLGWSAYSEYRQYRIDDFQMRHMYRMDKRIVVLEEKLRSVMTSPVVKTVTSPSSATDSERPFRISIAKNDNSSEDIVSDPSAEMLQTIRQLSLHDSGIERLRRDISQLQLSRTERQSSMIQSSPDCGCPAGE